MKNTLLFLSIIISQLALSQGSRFMYEYSFAKDMNKKDTLEKELMYLDIKKDGSNFYSRTKFVGDSITNAIIDKQINAGSNNINIGNIKQGKVDYSVTKTYPDFDIKLNTRVGSDSYSVKNEKPMVWTISPEQKTIEKFEVQKATTEFGGRQWTAWFASEIPFQDGPYKFYGLPGLILEMEDASQTHIFKFVGNKNFDEVEKIESKNKGNSNIRISDNKNIDVTEDQFIKQWKAYKADPAKSMKQMLGGSASGGTVSVSMSYGGKTMSDPNEIIRSMEKSAKERIKTDNNKIEPSLYP